MNALNSLIQQVSDKTLENHGLRNQAGYIEANGGLTAVWSAHEASQRVTITAPGGATVECKGGFDLTRGVARLSWKINGKRAKLDDVQALFA